MEIKVCAVGGYNEVGKNMTAVKIDNEVIILDMGFYLPKIVSFEEEGGHRKNLTSKDLIDIGAVPNDTVISSWHDKVKAIIVSHCHLDHLGAVPYLANKYNCPIIATPYTIEVLRGMLKDDDMVLKNQIKSLNANSSLKISENIEIEFLHVNHSTLQTVIVVIHTKEGDIVYANDFKFDNSPVIGQTSNYEKLKKLNTLALISDSLYADTEGKTPSEKVARELLREVMLGTNNERNTIIVTTFSSHIARLKSAIEFGEKLNRKIVFLGRSLAKYTYAAEKLNLINFSKDVEICTYANQIRRKLSHIEKQGRDDYLIICTGNQGEPKAVLTKILNNILPFRFLPEDQVIFSCRTIPVEINIKNRALVESKLKSKKVRIFKDVHTSGHCSREDLRDLINLTHPKHIIPTHGDTKKLSYLSDLAVEMGYKEGKNVHVMHNGQILNLV